LSITFLPSGNSIDCAVSHLNKRSNTFEFFFTTATIGSFVLKLMPKELAAPAIKSPLSRLDVKECAIPF
jgi:hypothetical protein